MLKNQTTIDIIEVQPDEVQFFNVSIVHRGRIVHFYHQINAKH